LELIAEFFEKYPNYVDKAFLSIKVRILLSSWKATKEMADALVLHFREACYQDVSRRMDRK